MLIADYMISFWKLASTLGLPDAQDAREERRQHCCAYVPDTFGLCFPYIFLETAVTQEHIFTSGVL